MLNFSQRKGLKPVRTIIQREDADQELRTAVWNATYITLFSKVSSRSSIPNEEWAVNLLRYTWMHHGYTYDKFPRHALEQVIELIKKQMLFHGYGEMYDQVEFLVRSKDIPASVRDTLVHRLNKVFEKYLSAYRIVNLVVSDITEAEEIGAIEGALANSDKFAPVKEHIATALTLMSDRANPDYRNSIKESISAVEAACKIITRNQNALLSDVMKMLEKEDKLHPALARSFSSLYAYSGDADGIRHGLKDSQNLTVHDARFMLVSCSAFTNYLIVKLGNS